MKIACLRGLLGLLGEEDSVDVREHATAGDGHRAEELVELLIVAHRELKVARHDAALLVVASSVASELENLRAEVLEDGGEVHGRTGADAGRVLALLEVAADAADRELETSLGGPGGGLATSLAATTFSFARHDEYESVKVFVADLVEVSIKLEGVNF